MKKIGAVLTILMFCMFGFAACVPETKLTYEEVRAAFEDAGFSVSEMEDESRFEGLEKLLLISNGSDWGRVYVFENTGSKDRVSETITGSGLGLSCQNVFMSNFVIDDLPVIVGLPDMEYSLTSPEIQELTQPLIDLWAEKA